MFGRPIGGAQEFPDQTKPVQEVVSSGQSLGRAIGRHVLSTGAFVTAAGLSLGIIGYNGASAWVDGISQFDTAIAEHTTEVKKDELAVVDLGPFTMTPFAFADIVVRLNITDKTVTREITKQTLLGNITLPSVTLDSMTLEYNPLIIDEKTGKEKSRTLETMLLMYGDETLANATFNKSAFSRNTVKLASGATTDELEPVITIIINPSQFEAVQIVGDIPDNNNLYVVSYDAPATAGRAMFDTWLQSLPKNIRDKITNGEATSTEQREQYNKNLANYSVNEYAITCADTLMTAAQQSLDGGGGANAGGGKMVYLIQQKVAGTLNAIKGIRNEDREVKPQEVRVEITGDFMQAKPNQSSSPITKPTAANFVSDAFKEFLVYQEPQVQKEEATCDVKIPETPITETPEDTQKRLDDELATGVQK